MPKDKSSRTQNRKKQETDVSDALFHVTPQPTIDIFEALGGAINVQTAAFLTGKVDRLDAPLEQLDRDEPSATSRGNASPSALKSEDQVQVKNMAQFNMADALGKSGLEAQQTVPTNAPHAELSLLATNNETDTINIDKKISHKNTEENTQNPEDTVKVRSLEKQDSINSPELSHTYKNTELAAPSISNSHESPIIPAAKLTSKTDDNNAISHANNHAKKNDNAYISDTSMACNDQKNSMLDIQADSSHDSQPAINTNSIVHSIAKHPANSTQTSTAESSLPTLDTHQENSIVSSTRNSTQISQHNINQAPLYSGQNIPAHTPMQGSNLLTQLTKREEELLQFLRHHHGQIVSYSQMLKSLNWRESQRCTARNIIARFEANGIIQRQRIQGTRSQGYLFTMCEQAYSAPQQTPYSTYKNQHIPLQQNQMPSPAYSMQNSIATHNISVAPVSPAPSTVNSIDYSTQITQSNSTQASMPSYIDKIDRLIQSIWQSDQETIAACWPAVAAAGFRSAHLRQLQNIFELQGFESDTVSLGLRYLDWQLEQGPLTNARGEVIEDPVAYWLSSMRRHGYYSRPKGYLDPLLEAKRLLAEEEQAKLDLQAQLAQARQQNEQVAEDQRCEHLFTALMDQGLNHPLWSVFYQSLPQMFRQKVDAEGPEVLAKKFGMVKALLKELV